MASLRTLHVDTGDVVKVVLQFLRENGLTSSMAALQEESGVHLNAVDSIAAFQEDIRAGRWGSVMRQCGSLSLPPAKLVDLYEQVVIEMAELGEPETAKALLRSAPPCQDVMRRTAPDRYMRLERLVAAAASSGKFNERDAYLDGRSREARRADLAASLAEEVAAVPAGRLLTLVGQALRWQQYLGRLPPGTAFDVLRDAAPAAADEIERPPAASAGTTIRFGSKSHANCAAFTPDGQHLLTGSSDGFVEVYDWATGTLNQSLAYQASDDIMLHEAPVLCMAVSRDAEMVATGSQDGEIVVWKIETGARLREMPRAHTEGVTAITFAADGLHVLSGSFDQTARVHGLRSAKMLKEFRGHTAFINAVAYSADGTRVITGSSDGSVRVWNYKTGEHVELSPPSASATARPAVVSVALLPHKSDVLAVCTRARSVHLMSLSGEVVRSLSAGPPSASGLPALGASGGAGAGAGAGAGGGGAAGAAASQGEFSAFVVSPKGNYIYAASEDKQLYCFNVETGDLESVLPLGETPAAGLAHHPHRNLLATFGPGGPLRMWKP